MRITNEEVEALVASRSKCGRMTCAAAHALAKESRVPLRRVGKALDALGIRIVECQLGCFK
jgi:hypothetical protein